MIRFVYMRFIIAFGMIHKGKHLKAASYQLARLSFMNALFYDMFIAMHFICVYNHKEGAPMPVFILFYQLY